MNSGLIKVNELNIGDYMSHNPITVQSDLRVRDAVVIMIDNGIGNLIVTKNKRPIGILTEREVLRFLASWMKIPNNILSYFKLQSFSKICEGISITHAAKMMISIKSKLLVFNIDNGNDDTLIGIITASDIIRAFRNTELDPPLEDVMTRKIFHVNYNDTILKAITTMYSKRIGSVIVTNKNNNNNNSSDSNNNTEPYGIFTERDLITKIVFKDIGLSEKVGDYCTNPLVTARHGIRANEAANIMHLNKIKRLPLIDPLLEGNKIVSIVTARDIVEAFQKNQ
jgi:CBS domain-containing protein